MVKKDVKRKKRGINILKGVIEMKKTITDKRGDILNRLLLGLGVVVMGLTLAIGFKTLFFKPAPSGEEVVLEKTLMEEKLKEMVKEEFLEEEILKHTLEAPPTFQKSVVVSILPQLREISTSQKKYAHKERERIDIAKRLEERGISVQEIKPLEEFNKLMARGEIEELAEEEIEEDLGISFAEHYVPGVVMVKQKFSDGTIELNKIEVTVGKEEEVIKELSAIPGIEAYRDGMIFVHLCGVPKQGTPGGIPGGTPSPSPISSPSPSPTSSPSPGPDLYQNKQWGLEKIEVPAAWALLNDYYGGRYREVRIAIIDTGCDLNHPDLKAQIDLSASKNFIDKTRPPQDDSGHGTHVAGIIGAVIRNGIGIAGIVPKPRLIIIKALDEEGIGSSSVLAEAISYALNSKARIINISWGSHRDLLKDNTLRPVLRRALHSDVLLVASAGNHAGRGLNGEYWVLYPARYRKVLGVGGTDREDQRWKSAEVDETGSSNPLDEDYNPWYGKHYESAYGRQVKIYAPAGDALENIYSTVIGGYDYNAGTSMSAAFVSGVAGLMLTAAPYLTKEELMEIIRDTAEEIEILDIDGKPTPEKELRVNAISAVEDLLPLEDELWIMGRVLDSDGKGVKDLSVRVKSADLKSDKTVKTDDKGRYMIKLNIDDFNSEEDYYELQVSVDGKSEYDPQTIEDAILGEYYVVDFSPETTEEDEIIIKGTVRNSLGQVLRDVTVRAKSEDLEEDLTAKTDENGAYRIEIGLEDLREDKSEYSIKLSVDNHPELREETVKAKLGKVHIVDFGSAPANNEIIIRGTVTENGNAKQGVKVKMRLETQQLTAIETKETTTDSDGKYEIKFSGLDTSKKYKIDLLEPRTHHNFRTDLEPGKIYENCNIELGLAAGGGGGDSLLSPYALWLSMGCSNLPNDPYCKDLAQQITWWDLPSINIADLKVLCRQNNTAACDKVTREECGAGQRWNPVTGNCSAAESGTTGPRSGPGTTGPGSLPPDGDIADACKACHVCLGEMTVVLEILRGEDGFCRENPHAVLDINGISVSCATINDPNYSASHLHCSACGECRARGK